MMSWQKARQKELSGESCLKHLIRGLGASQGVSTPEGALSTNRVQQIEHSDTIEIATLVRIAAACGYQVGISLEPLSPGMRAFSTVLPGATR